MVKELNYTTIAHVVETWELAKLKPAFEERTGTMILERLFQLEPRSKKVFGFNVEDDINDCPRRKIGALIHAKRMIHMLDTVMSMLGPDSELLTEVLSGLGKRHIQYGVKPSFFPYMGVAIIDSLHELLGDSIWNVEVEKAWTVVYEELSHEITKSILNGEDSDLDSLPDTTIATVRVL